MPGNIGDRTPTAPPRSDSGVCAISPSDLVGATGNLINRVKDLEQEVAELKAMIVQVNQLSDLSGQIGWIGGITYMGVPGWTQTSYGTLIPPPGFSLSTSGFELYNACTGQMEDYQGVIMDEDGVLQFGFTATGGLCGEKVEAWNDAAVDEQDYARARWTASGWVTSNRDISIATSSPASQQRRADFTVTRAGIYIVTSGLTDLISAASQQSSDVLSIYKNEVSYDGNSVQDFNNNFPSGGWAMNTALSVPIVLAASDVVSVLNNNAIGFTIIGLSAGLVRISA